MQSIWYLALLSTGMLQLNNRQVSTKKQSPAAIRAEIDELHTLCGIYTNPKLVEHILDAVGWTERSNLAKYRLLEPSAGDGAFVLEAARRLIASCSRSGIRVDTGLGRCIAAFELHPLEANKCRRKLVALVTKLGATKPVALSLARQWIKTADFLLASAPLEKYTHAVGNPPYVRWSKIPSGLRLRYRANLSASTTSGDLFLPFLDRALNDLEPNGKLGFVCSNRWRYTGFATKFRANWLPRIRILAEDAIAPSSAYTKPVDAYPSVLIAQKLRKPQPIAPCPTVQRGKTLVEHGFEIKVGPALGFSKAFVIEGSQAHELERELLHPWVDASEVLDGDISWRGRLVAALYDSEGALVDLKKFPKAYRRFRRFRTQLEARSIVRNGAPWFRPIDKVCGSQWTKPKLLVPEIAKVPRVAFDHSGLVPSHGVYAIFGPAKKLEQLDEFLANGGLAKALEGIAPQIKGGYVRCYKRFLEQVVLD